MNTSFSKMRGFTLIEALAALVVLSLVFTSVWAWFGTAVQSTTRIEEMMALPQVFEEYMERMSLESLEENGGGQFIIDGFLFEWKATVARQSNQEFFWRQRTRLVTLFNVDIRVSKQQRFVTELSTQLVRQIENPAYSQGGLPF